MSSHRVIFEGGSQVLTFSPHKRVTSADYIIEEFVSYPSGSTDRIIASGSATLNGADTGITQASGPNTTDPRLLVVASVVDVTASHRYVITHATTGEYETFSVESVQGSNIKTQAPLLQAYPSGSSVQGLELSAVFPAASAGDEDLLNRNEPLRIAWKYTVDGRIRHDQEQIDLVHHNHAIDIDSVIEELQTAWGGLTVRFEDGRTIRGQVKFAIRDIRRRLLGRNLRPEQFLTGEQGELMTFWRTTWHMAMYGNHPPNVDPEIFREEAKAQFEATLNNLTIGHPGEGVRKTSPVYDQGSGRASVKYRNIIRKA